ncbi:VOC family protein [Nesterenkonia sp. HG001]|uniref:VOC family protein n=1 Tax=Nesterenkonia sp. HG001 TaxID=2983207 RepID=UPI002AC490D2|nr:VOC family protein [Nesterenkonia sp. HG001]MDZ5076415.1 VOC family protein [Nesterenkonia sp. HG001]
MTLCLPFLMFQGRAQEAIDLYLETFSDAELIEIQLHPEGTEILDVGPPEEDEVEEDSHAEDSDAEDGTTSEDEAAAHGEDTDGEDLAQDEETSPSTGTDLTTVEAEQEQAPPTRLVATAQVQVGGQMLMIQDSLVRHDFSFTPSVSVAVVVDSSTEFDDVVEKLSEGGSFLMEPGDYDFAKNFAWVQDRFGMCWQVNHPLTAPDENIARAQAPDWG